MNLARIETLQEIASQRSKNNVIFINVGDLDEIDVYFRNRRCKTIFQIPDRYILIALHNRAVIGMGGDRFGMDLFEWKVRQMHSINWLGQINALYSLPTQYGIGTIPLLPQDIFNHYLELKNTRNSILDQQKEILMQKRLAKYEKIKKKTLQGKLSFD